MITIQKDLKAYDNESLWQYYKDIPTVNNDGDSNNNNGNIHNNRDKYVPLVTLSTQDNSKLLPQLKNGFKRQWLGINI